MSGRCKPILIRLYQESTEADSCAEAIRLLLKRTEREQKGACPGASDDAQRLNNDRTDTEIIPK